jgi:hypothetical protein
MTGALMAISIVFIVIGGIAAITVSYHRLQRHRADAVALAGYRRLAEEAATAQTDIENIGAWRVPPQGPVCRPAVDHHRIRYRGQSHLDSDHSRSQHRRPLRPYPSTSRG